MINRITTEVGDKDILSVEYPLSFDEGLVFSFTHAKKTGAWVAMELSKKKVEELLKVLTCLRKEGKGNYTNGEYWGTRKGFKKRQREEEKK